MSNFWGAVQKKIPSLQLLIQQSFNPNSEEGKAVSSNLKYVQIRGFQAPTQQRLQYPEVPPIWGQLHKWLTPRDYEFGVSFLAGSRFSW